MANDSKTNTHITFTPPNALKTKLGSGGVSTELIQKAEFIAEKYAQEFSIKANDSIEVLRKLLKELPSAETEVISLPVWTSMYKAAHEMLGEGATFGYPIVSDIARTLLVYLEAFKGKPFNTVILKAHIDALLVILKQGIKTNDKNIVKDLCTTLEDIVSKAIAN